MKESVDVNVSDVVQYLRFDGTFGSALSDVVKRKVAVQEARERGISVSDEELQDAANTFRQANGLQRAEDAQAWLNERGLDLEEFEELIEENVLISRLKDQLQEDSNKQELLESDRGQSFIREWAYGEWLASELEGEG